MAEALCPRKQGDWQLVGAEDAAVTLGRRVPVLRVDRSYSSEIVRTCGFCSLASWRGRVAEGIELEEVKPGIHLHMERLYSSRWTLGETCYRHTLVGT